MIRNLRKTLAAAVVCIPVAALAANAGAMPQMGQIVSGSHDVVISGPIPALSVAPSVPVNQPAAPTFMQNVQTYAQNAAFNSQYWSQQSQAAVGFVSAPDLRHRMERKDNRSNPDRLQRNFALPAPQSDDMQLMAF